MIKKLPSLCYGRQLMLKSHFKNTLNIEWRNEGKASSIQEKLKI
jgi:hypothetical protein